jgi:hypothetical protein
MEGHTSPEHFAPLSLCHLAWDHSSDLLIHQWYYQKPNLNGVRPLPMPTTQSVLPVSLSIVPTSYIPPIGLNANLPEVSVNLNRHLRPLSMSSPSIDCLIVEVSDKSK